MIVISVAAIFVALFILVSMAFPGRHVPRSRLGIERSHLSLSTSVEAALERHGRRRGLAQALSLAGISVTPGQFVLRVAVVSILLAILGLLAHPVVALALLVAPTLVARTWVGYKAGKRRAAFAQQVPDFLRSLVMSLRTGFGIAQALDAAAEESPQPMRAEIERVLAEVRVGRSLSEAMSGLSERMDNQDLEWVVGAIDINREAGGNLSDILATVDSTLRERARLQRKIKTFTAEGRLSAKILTATPFLFALWQWRAHPEGFSALFSGAGWIVIVFCAALLAVGWLWIKRVITIKI
jgi:tight adherence protein B